jgi:hypothetical protein
MRNRDLTIPMPATCTAWYLVSGKLDPAEARATALREVDEHAAGVTRHNIEAMAATPGVISFGAVTEEDLAAMTEEQRDLILEPDGWVSVKVQTRTDWFPYHEWAARTLAGLLGSWSEGMRYRSGGLVLDMTTATGTRAAEMLASLHAKECGSVRVADWVRVGSWFGRVRTRGLSRYGLPELTVSGLGYSGAEQWCALLTGIAFRVIVDEFMSGARCDVWNEAAIAGRPAPNGVPETIQISDVIGLTGDDVADAYCLPGSFESRRWGTRWTRGEDGAPMRLRLDDGSDDLVVEPPREWLPSKDKRGRTSEGVLPEWSAIGEARPFIERCQQIREWAKRSRNDDILADLDLVTRS